MTGFDVYINQENISAAVDKGVLALIVSRLHNDQQEDINLSISGLDSQAEKRRHWADINLKEGDEIVVRIKDVKEITTPSSADLDHKQPDTGNELQQFYALKESLEKEGLI